MRRRHFAFPVVCVTAALLLAACSGGGHASLPPRAPTAGNMNTLMPKSVSPALVKPAPMASTVPLPASAMRSPRTTDTALQGLNWTQMTGSASQVVAAGDGSIWVLSDQPSGSTDKYIWHFANNAWTNIPGMASRIAVTPGGNLYAVNSGGGTYLYNTQTAQWTALGGGALDVTAAADGSTYVLSNAGSGPDYAIWHNEQGVWTQVPGAGVRLAASLDTGTYTAGATLTPGGLYVINSAGSIYYHDPVNGWIGFPGAASDIAPTSYGGLFVLAYPNNSAGEQIYYFDLDNPQWQAQPGQAKSMSIAGGHLYVVASNGAIYSTNAQPVAGSVWTKSNPSGYNAWTPYDIGNAYQFPASAGYDGKGETVAIVIDAVPDPNDTSTYLNYVGITRRGQIASEPVDGGGATDTEGEATLDLQTIAGLAPGANVMIYNVPSLSGSHLIDAYNQVLADGNANVVSMSYGGCEWQGVDQVVAPIFAQMAAQGIAAVASSGDTGNQCYNGGTYVLGAENPASDPSVIGVGGTETGTPFGGGSVVGTVVWNDCPNPITKAENCMGGGGVSGNAANAFAGYPIPSFQQGIAGEASTSLRNVPDIALPADNDLSYMNSAGGWIGNGGTSWSAPMIAAMVSEIYEYCGVTAVHNPVTMFYTAFADDGYNDFVDVTSGSNSFMGQTPAYTGGTGFDNISGIGEPLGLSIAQRLCPNNRPTMIRPASHGYVALQERAPATPRVMQNVVRPSGAPDLGERAASAPTRIALVMRQTPTIAQDEQTVIADLRGAGFSIVRTFSNHLVVDAQAPASVVERYFGTRIHDFAQGRYGTHFANTQPDVLPASIAPYVNGVLTQDLVLARGIPVHRQVLAHR